jgi:hypothetical protein
MKRRKLIRIKREIQDTLFSAVFSAKEQIYGEIEYINSRIWEVKKEVCYVLDKCKNIDELLNITDFTLTDTINDIIGNFGNLLVNVEKKYHDDVIHTGENIFNRYGIKGLNSDGIDLCKFEFTKDDKDWIIKESDNLIYETVIEAIDYIADDTQGYSNSSYSFDYKINEYKKRAKQIISGGIDHLAENLLRKVIEYYIVELVDNIKITKKSFDLLIDRNADLSKQFCDGKVGMKNGSNVEKSSTMDSDIKNILKINFISTTSSGKSTLINAILNTELLPSENKVCTATICKILDNDTMDHYEATCYADDGVTEIYPRQTIALDSMKEFNSNDIVRYIDIEGRVPINSSDNIRLCLRDIPGPNNSRDESHSRLINNIIKETNSVVLYVMSATQIAIKDDEQLLRTISDEMKQGGKQPRDRFIFVVNKCDELDEGKGETVDKILQSVREYLNEFDITEPTLIPTSARLALIIRKNIRGEVLSRNERSTLNEIKDFIEVKELHYEEYATLTSTVREKLQDLIEEYHSNEDKCELEALIHTGVPVLEEVINGYIEKYIYNVDNEEYSSLNRNDISNAERNVMYLPNRESFLCNDFFPAGVSVDEGSIFPMIVMATMSSGKSTLINALLGNQILPSKNEACTAKKYMVLDDDNSDGTTIYITYKNGETLIKEENIAEELEKANNNDDVVEVLIKDDVKGVLNTDRALLVVDTPGPNNSRDESHERVMEDVISKVKGGLFLYVMNATQMGINDDMYLLSKIREQINNNPKISLIFVLNKVDQLDEDKGESVEQFVVTAKEYLLSNGIENPYIIPVSALSASLFKKVLNGRELTRNEYRLFCDFYDVYKPKDYSMRSFAITDTLKNQNAKIQMKGNEYIVRDLNRAIDNTGIRLLEEEIQKSQILSSGIIKNTVNIGGGK